MSPVENEAAGRVGDDRPFRRIQMSVTTRRRKPNPLERDCLARLPQPQKVQPDADDPNAINPRQIGTSSTSPRSTGEDVASGSEQSRQVFLACQPEARLPPPWQGLMRLPFECSTYKCCMLEKCLSHRYILHAKY